MTQRPDRTRSVRYIIQGIPWTNGTCVNILQSNQADEWDQWKSKEAVERLVGMIQCHGIRKLKFQAVVDVEFLAERLFALVGENGPFKSFEVQSLSNPMYLSLWHRLNMPPHPKGHVKVELSRDRNFLSIYSRISDPYVGLDLFEKIESIVDLKLNLGQLSLAAWQRVADAIRNRPTLRLLYLDGDESELLVGLPALRQALAENAYNDGCLPVILRGCRDCHGWRIKEFFC